MSSRHISVPNIEALGAKLRTQDLMIRQLTSMLAALLIEKHEGTAFVPIPRFAETFGVQSSDHGHLVKLDPLPELGTYRLKVHLPDGTPYLHLPKTNGVHVVEPSLPEPLTCVSEWHRDKEAAGVLCPECGRKDKIESLEFASA